MRKLIKKHENGFLFAQAILTIIGLFMTGYIILKGNTTYESIVSYVLYILLVVYVCWGYKAPHGNSLKFLGLLLAAAIVYTGMTVIVTAQKQSLTGIASLLDNSLVYLFLLAAVGVAYVSGRLDKYFSNSIILIVCIILLFIAITSYQDVISASLTFEEASQQTRLAVHLASYNPPILLATFGIAYLTRYEEHIDAGKKEDLKAFKD